MIRFRPEMTIRFTFRLALILLLSAGLAGFDQPSVKRSAIERSGRGWVQRLECAAPVREGGKLVLRAHFGSVEVKAGASDRMECKVAVRAYMGNETRARRYLEEYDLTVRPLENGGVYVSGKGPDGDRGNSHLGAEFEITVPARFNLDLETAGGNINLRDSVQGEARLTTAGGDLRTADVSGALRAETAGGSISLGNIGQRLDARTAGGSIRVGNAKGEAILETSGGEIAIDRADSNLRAETAGGDVVVGSAGGQVVAQTAGGQIRIGPTGGSVRAQTAGGSIWLQAARGRVDVETAGGSIDLFQVQGAVRATTAAGRILAQINCNRQTFGASQLETSMGDVQVYLPPDLPLTIDAAIEMAAGHRIVSDFPLEIKGDQEEFVEGEIRGHGALNGGGETLRIRTVNGNIEIRKLDAQTIEKLKERQDTDWGQSERRRVEKEQRRREQEEERRREKE